MKMDMKLSVAGTFSSSSGSFDVERYRQDFPILQTKMNGKPLVYFDNAATTQKPKQVIDATGQFYLAQNANIHRGVYALSEDATQAFERSRIKLQNFLNAASAHEIIFVRGATEAINLVAQSYGGAFLKKSDEILISAMEHHSNIVPWQMIAEKTGAKLRVIPINDAGEIMIEDYDKFLNKKTKIVALAHVSNALGTINPVKEMIRRARAYGAMVLIDGAQAAPHLKVDVQDLDCDFYCLSGHKLYGPTGIGVLYGKTKLLDQMPPYQGGGDMISAVTFEKTIYNELPFKFEAGTPDIAGAIGLAEAVDYVSKIGLENIEKYEKDLLDYAQASLSQIRGLKLIGTAREKAAVVSFIMDCAHAHDVGTILDQDGIAIRAGHHCAMPVMERFQVPATARASFAFYNTRQEIDSLVDSLLKVGEIFS
jgi:cysteine desulfurase/selenocysteine lyase